jgi:hypothetical protein
LEVLRFQPNGLSARAMWEALNTNLQKHPILVRGVKNDSIGLPKTNRLLADLGAASQLFREGEGKCTRWKLKRHGVGNESE